MTVKTLYVCDRCGKEWELSKDKTNQIVNISLDFNFGNITRRSISYYGQSATWCRECVMKLGVHEPVTDKDKIIAPEKILSFEEKVITLLQELGVKFEED